MDQFTEIFRAINSSNLSRARAILDSGFDVNAVDPQSKLSPLLVAVRDRNVAMASLFLERGADPNSRDRYEDSERNFAIHFAASNDDILNLRLLLDYGANINARDRLLRTPLSSSIISFAFGCAEDLVRRGADPNLADQYHSYPLHFAVNKDAPPRLIDLMLEHGADVNRTNNKGRKAWELPDNNASRYLKSLLERRKLSSMTVGRRAYPKDSELGV